MFFLPWHDDILRDAAVTAATLVVGARGTGAEDLALRLAMRFTNSDNIDTNPDIMRIEREADKNVIPVDALTDVFQFLALAPVSGDCRVVVLLEAERLNVFGINRLLKTLEEPQKNRHIILSARSVQQLPATIVSRCHLLAAPVPDEETARQWLADKLPDNAAALLSYCGGLPLAALDISPDWFRLLVDFLRQGSALDIPTAAAAFAKKDADDWLDGLQKWASDGVRVACGSPAKYFPTSGEILSELVGGSAMRWLNFQRWLCDRRALALHPLAKDLFTKEILYVYRRLCAH